MYFIQNLNKKQRSRLKKAILLLFVILLFFLVFYIKKKLWIQSVISDYEAIQEYELFIPDKNMFNKMAQEQIISGNLKGYQDTPEEIDQAAYEVFYNIVKELEEKFECQLICFNQVYVGGKKNEYIIYTYDRNMSDVFMNFDFFQVKKGRLFEDEKNELVIVKGNKDSINQDIIYKGADNTEYKFSVVGRLKRNYLPIGNMFTEKVSCQVMDFQANKKTVYLLNPNSKFCKSKNVKGNVSMVYVKFQEKDVIEGKKYLEKYGTVTKMKLE
ncbi:MAG: hypothetical protein HDR01_10290 [Lachnospiraceae bacterium]|nr:hypothetical protein [Lachnospiraceae bacterium]